jgi:hypothetical protein
MSEKIDGFLLWRRREYMKRLKDLMTLWWRFEGAISFPFRRLRIEVFHQHLIFSFKSTPRE